MAALAETRGFMTEVCESSAELRTRMSGGTGALLITEGALELAALPDLLHELETQPS
jgi:hypothetical protein